MRSMLLERGIEKDYINKLVVGLTRLFPNTLHVFEDLEKEDLTKKDKTPKSRRKRNARTPWITIQKRLAEKIPIAKISPRNTSRTCPRCGFVVKTQVGRVFKCLRCGFEIDRQKLASINIYIRYTRMRGFPHSDDLEKAMRGELRVGGHPERAESSDMGPNEMGP